MNGSTLKRSDLVLLGVAVVTSLIGGWWGTTATLPQLLQFEWYSALPLLPLAAVSLWATIKFTDIWGGDLGRYLGLIGITTVFGLLNLVLHIRWHVVGRGFQDLPAWGISVDFWIIFFHLAVVVVFLVIAYAARELSRTGQSA